MSATLPFMMNAYKASPINIRILFKVTHSDYVDDFLSGKLYMNPFEYFRSLEEKIIRGDDLEGVDASYRSEDIKLQVANNQGELITVGKLIDRCNFHNNYIKNSNMISLTGFSLEHLSNGNNQFFLDPRFAEFGDKTILIYDVPTFFSKVQIGFKSKEKIIEIPNEPFYLRHIDYVSSNYNGRLGAFRKLETYKWQQEIRVAIYRNFKEICSKPYLFNVGSLKRITLVFDTKKLITEGLVINQHS